LNWIEIAGTPYAPAHFRLQCVRIFAKIETAVQQHDNRIIELDDANKLANLVTDIRRVLVIAAMISGASSSVSLRAKLKFETTAPPTAGDVTP
jgi:hypothetical protein